MSDRKDDSTPTFDQEFLLRLAREKSTKGRARLSETIMDLLDNKGNALTVRPVEAFFEKREKLTLIVNFRGKFRPILSGCGQLHQYHISRF
ncbi:MAG: hypothetical protein VW268_03030 [Rhodospirillaceae bacterium]